MNGFTGCGAGAWTVPPDPSKRVNFMQGLVLGVDELTQESAYLANRSEWLARELLGYGTVVGLRVSSETRSSGAAIVVGPGSAVSRRGRPIRVPMSQALALNEWLDARRNELPRRLGPGKGSPPHDQLNLCVVLSYQQCGTDNQPAAGEPCRTDELPQVYTRLADDFRLELRFDVPEQREGEATRGFVSWLNGIEFVESGPTATLEEFLEALRTAALSRNALDFAPASPPEPLRIHVADTTDFLRAALVVWTTELRPMLRTVAPEDDAVLLAEVYVPVVLTREGRWTVDEPAHILVRQDRRPYLVSLRLLQDLIGFTRSVVTAERQPRPSAPPSLPFTVVAAGIIKGDEDNATHRLPLFNGLRVVRVRDSSVSFTFDGYEEPDPRGDFQYIVKATSGPKIGAGAVINLSSFEAKFIRLSVLNSTGPQIIPAAELKSLEISIEVTRYQAETRS